MRAFDIRQYESLGSTSDEAFRLAREGAAHATVVTAREQTAGRGRVGRGWDSPVGNLYLSVLLRLDLAPGRIAELSFVAALAVAEMVDAFAAGRVSLKWPNDVLIDGAKVAGILVEQANGATVIGIGVNVAHCPSGLAYPVTSLVGASRAPLPLTPSRKGRGDSHSQSPLPLREGVGGGVADVPLVRTTLLAALSRRLDAWLADGFATIRTDWLARAHPTGTPLRAGALHGTFATIGPDGTLLLDTPTGRVRIVGGEVQSR
ncbi:MAG TPA: biotin--[acetyl-CoA-carboxylase] ligase [Acetobacteraceae bacterium]